MSELFKPPRRRIGVLVLVVACAFAAGWVRSQQTIDSTAFSLSGNSLNQLISYKSTLTLRRIESAYRVKGVDGVVDRVILLQSDGAGFLLFLDEATRAGEQNPYHWDYRGQGFGKGDVEIVSRMIHDPNFPTHVFIWHIPHCVIAQSKPASDLRVKAGH